MFSLLYTFGMLLFISTCYSLSIYVLAVQILSEKAAKKTALLYCTIFYGIQVIANILLIQGVAYDEEFLVNWNIYLYTLHVAILIFLLLWTYRTSAVRTISAASLGHFVVFTVGSLAEEILSSYVPRMDNIYLYSVLISILPHTIMMISSLLITLLLGRLEFNRYFEALFRNKVSAWVTLTVSLLLMHIHTIIRLLYPVKRVSLITASYSVALIAVALFFLLYAARYHDSRAHYINNNMAPVISGTFSADMISNQTVRWSDVLFLLIVNSILFLGFLAAKVFKDKKLRTPTMDERADAAVQVESMQ